MNDLFGKREPRAPLAEQLRPKTLDDVAGQTHLVGPGKPLRLAFESKKPHSMILWGPPGVGKTTLTAAITHRTHHLPRDWFTATTTISTAALLLTTTLTTTNADRIAFVGIGTGLLLLALATALKIGRAHV